MRVGATVLIGRESIGEGPFYKHQKLGRSVLILKKNRGSEIFESIIILPYFFFQLSKLGI